MDTTTYTEFHVYRPSPGLVIVFTAASRYQRPPLARDEEGHFPGRPSEPRPCPLEGRFFVPAAEVSRERILEEVAYMSLDWCADEQVERLSIDPEQVRYQPNTRCASPLGAVLVTPAAERLPLWAMERAVDRVEAESELDRPLGVDTACRWLDGERVGLDRMYDLARIARLWAFSVWAEGANGTAEPIAGPFVLAEPPPVGTEPPRSSITSLRRRVAMGEDIAEVLPDCYTNDERRRLYGWTHVDTWPGSATRDDALRAIHLGLVEPLDPWHTALRITGTGRAAAVLGGVDAPAGQRGRILALLHSVDERGIVCRPRKRSRADVDEHEIEAWRAEAAEVSSAPIDAFAGGPSSAAADLLAH